MGGGALGSPPPPDAGAREAGAREEGARAVMLRNVIRSVPSVRLQTSAPVRTTELLRKSAFHPTHGSFWGPRAARDLYQKAAMYSNKRS